MNWNQLETIRSDESSREMTSNDDETPFLHSVTYPTSRDPPEVAGSQNGYAGKKQTVFDMKADKIIKELQSKAVEAKPVEHL